MKTAASTILLCSVINHQASAFSVLPQPKQATSLFAADYELSEGEAKMNLKIDLDAEKVVNMEELKAGEKKVYCRCWLSGTFPLCDGTHMKHNGATGDNVGPLIVSGPKKES